MVRQASPLTELSVQYVKGVGPSRAKQLGRLGIATVEELLLAVPRRYEDRTQFVSIAQLIPGRLATIRGALRAKHFLRSRGGRPLVQADVSDHSGTVQCLWFNQSYLVQQLAIGEELILYGKVEPLGRRLQMIHPELERVEPAGEDSADGEGGEAALHMGRIVPIYPLTSGMGQRWFRRLIHTVLTQHLDQLDEVLPEPVRVQQRLRPRRWAVQQVHFPSTWEELDEARRGLVFEELFLMQLRLAIRRAKLAARRKPQRYQIDGPLRLALLKQLPFTLTKSQQHVLEELVDDLQQPAPMLRLLQGDVGCGKTAVAAAVMAVAVQSGYQVALMAPTELLAEQHGRLLAGYFEPLGVKTTVLSNRIPAASRQPLLGAIADGTISIVVGTHALIERGVSFQQLALVVIDEQHKFGVAQRTALIKKSAMPDVLVMTATPIPRTLALSLYGDLTCSTITELPPGRQPVRTLLQPESARQDIYRLIREELRAGRQGYVVYPRIESKEEQDVKAATHMARQLQQIVFPDCRVALLHGQMRTEEQARVMQAFVQGDVQLLVSTVIVEVGLDVPNATIMLIEHPERFGLAQLHQLRGRIGRGTHPATCLVLSAPVEESVEQRLSAFVSTTDGFRLAEYDLAFRGPGELLGRRQHGWVDFRVADLAKDQAVLETAREAAFALVAGDPSLAAAEPTAPKGRGSR